MMEFLVQFELNIPDGVPESEVEDRERAEAAAAETLAGEGHLVRLWQAPVGTSRKTVLGLYRAGSKAELNGLLRSAAIRMDAYVHHASRSASERPDEVRAIAK
jgi:muconolactone delta-isomerase